MKGGAVQQSNFNDYHVLRMSDMPELHIKIIATNNPPTGMGEVGIPTVAPAIGNAVAHAHRQAAPPPADVVRPGEEGAGLKPAPIALIPAASRRGRGGLLFGLGRELSRPILRSIAKQCVSKDGPPSRGHILRDAVLARSYEAGRAPSSIEPTSILMAMEVANMDDKTRTELEAAVYRRLVEHLRTRTDVQNIDMMNLAGFCRNCLSNWMKDAADAKGVPMTKDQSREIVYGEPFDQWKAKHQKEASPDQKAAFDKVVGGAQALTCPFVCADLSQLSWPGLSRPSR